MMITLEEAKKKIKELQTKVAIVTPGQLWKKPKQG